MPNFKCSTVFESQKAECKEMNKRTSIMNQKRLKTKQQKKMIFCHIFALVNIPLLIALSGCSSYSESFDCPIGEGLKCASLSEVNQKIDEQAIPLGLPSQKQNAVCKGCQKVYWRDELEGSLSSSNPSSDYHKKEI